MTVRELIEWLERKPENARVMLNPPEYSCGLLEVVFVDFVDGEVVLS